VILEAARDLARVYQVMYGLGGVHVPAADTPTEGNAAGAVIADRFGLTDPDDDRILRLRATAHGLIALSAMGKLPADRPHLKHLLAASVDDLLNPDTQTTEGQQPWKP
jgi:hypothetical protein